MAAGLGQGPNPGFPKPESLWHDADGGAMSEHRLPTTVSPRRYHIHLTADPAKPDFAAAVTIHVDVEEPVADIVLHADNLTIDEVTIEQEAVQRAAISQKGDRLTLTPPAPLAAGAAVLRIKYSGKVRHDMAGLYLSKDGERACLATQCEATDARSIVPCWDEPSCKAVWQWTVTAPADLTVLTNGPVEATQTEGGVATHTFAETPAMSSYLIACCIGDFASTKAIDARDTPFKVWAMQGQEQHGDKGNELAAQMLPWYEDYFGQPYAFGKYDQIAVPSFAFGAMENAGLVLFRPSLVLLDKATASWDDRRSVALVVAHEFAHMWFGNLVTMAWWDDLWLNEAFAEWIAHKCADAMDPSLDVWVPFRQRAAGALSTDALGSTHAIYHPVKTPEEAQEMFDAVTYGKGSAVMRMLESYLGEEAFCAGLRAYMATFAFDNAEGKDLWSHLANASGQDVAGIMGDWVKQAGHPTVTCRWDGALHLGQYRTTSSPLIGEIEGTWRVPLVIRYADDAGVHEHRHLLTGSESIRLDVQGQLKWLWPNADDGGFYRVQLDAALLDLALANVEALSAPERVGLLRDLWMQVRSGRQGIAPFLATLEATLDGSAHYEVVEFQVGVLRMIDGLLHDRPEQAAFREWVAATLHAAWEGAPAKTDADKQRRAALLRAVGAVALHPEAVVAAGRLADEERAGNAKDTELASVAVAVEAAAGDLTTLAMHMDVYNGRREGSASPQDVERYVYALPQYRDPAAIARILELLAKEGIAAQAEGPVLRAMLVSPASQRAAWQHLQATWASTTARLGEAWLGIIVEACGELPTADAADVIAFIEPRLKGRAGQSWMRAQERLKERAELEARVGPDLRAWASALVASIAR